MTHGLGGIMTKSLSELIAGAKEDWSEEDHVIFEAATGAFALEALMQSELGSALAEARAELNLSQQKLSEITGVQQSEISRIENGLGNPTTSTLTRLAGALGRRVTLIRRDAG